MTTRSHPDSLEERISAAVLRHVHEQGPMSLEALLGFLSIDFPELPEDAISRALTALVESHHLCPDGGLLSPVDLSECLRCQKAVPGLVRPGSDRDD